jgi:hypothetical protein
MLLPATGGSADVRTDDADEAVTESGETPGTERAGMDPEARRSYARMLARMWLPILLLLIIFVALLMVISRRLRLWVLRRNRPVKFDRVDDVWWKKRNEQ